MEMEQSVFPLTIKRPALNLVNINVKGYAPANGKKRRGDTSVLITLVKHKR